MKIILLIHFIVIITLILDLEKFYKSKFVILDFQSNHIWKD